MVRDLVTARSGDLCGYASYFGIDCCDLSICRRAHISGGWWYRQHNCAADDHEPARANLTTSDCERCYGNANRAAIVAANRRTTHHFAGVAYHAASHGCADPAALTFSDEYTHRGSHCPSDGYERAYVWRYEWGWCAANPTSVCAATANARAG
jgi:hypothetical protein